MSAYGHQMEREFSAQSLPSRGGSEMGSRFVVESGFYVTSFAATFFIGGLVTTGILLVTLLIALAVMLQSCQSKSSGLVELQISSDRYNYCQIFAQHAEINNLELDDFPSICRDFTLRYIKEGQYAKDLNISMSLIESYFDSVTPPDDGLDVVLMDIDDIHASNFQFRNVLLVNRDRIDEAKYLMHIHTLKLHKKLHASGWPLILLSRKPERQQNTTIEHLISAGYSGWSSLIMRLENEMQLDSQEYFAKRRALLEKEGFRITGVVSSHMDALTGQCLGKRIFKLPNPVYYILEGKYM